MTGRFLSIALLLLPLHAEPASQRLLLKAGAARMEVESVNLTNIPKRRASSRSHILVQFRNAPGRTEIEGLQRRGAAILGYVPESGFLISADDGIALDGLGLRWAGRLRYEDKLSPLLLQAADAQSTQAAAGEHNPAAFIVEFHPDVDPEEARALVGESSVSIRPHPDLLGNHVLVEGAPERIMALAEWDEVAYIYPASRELVDGVRVHACAGAASYYGPIGQYVAKVGEGWDGPGQNEAELGYYFGALTARLPETSVRSEILRALAEWAKYAKLSFVAASEAFAPRTLAILFASGEHGDPFPFDGPRGVLAHSFYPAPPNPEPLAGDIHFDADEDWSMGGRTDLFTIALHEAGHALGLGHSDLPGAVMYPYYHQAVGLTPDDIAAIRELYAARDGALTPPTEPPPLPGVPAPALALIVQNPPATTTAETVLLMGTAAGGTGEVRIGWRTDRGYSGIAEGSLNWTIRAAPLTPGNNLITVTATDSSDASVSRDLAVVRYTGSAAPSSPDLVAPSLTILYPTSTNLLTYQSAIALKGTASDNVGVEEVTWSVSSGASGTAQGIANWTTPAIPLLKGTNTITVRARDRAGNVGWRSVVVTHRTRKSF